MAGKLYAYLLLVIYQCLLYGLDLFALFLDNAKSNFFFCCYFII